VCYPNPDISPAADIGCQDELTFRTFPKYSSEEHFDAQRETPNMSRSNSYRANGIGHFDVAGPDITTLKDFYSAAFGWKVDVKGPGYAPIRTPDGSADGAMIESETPGITIGVVVPDLSRAIEAAESMVA
jgi:hypothetical protein